MESLFSLLNGLGNLKTKSRIEFVEKLKDVRYLLAHQSYKNINLQKVKGKIEVQFLDWENLCSEGTNTIEETKDAIKNRMSRERINFTQMEIITK